MKSNTEVRKVGRTTSHSFAVTSIDVKRRIFAALTSTATRELPSRYLMSRPFPSVSQKDDRFTFAVRRSVVPEVSFQGAAGERFVLRLAQQLPNTAHTLELRPVKDGEAAIARFDSYRPALGSK